MELDHTKVHEGSGKITHEGEVVGEVERIAFIFQHVGFDLSRGDDDTSCYGTVWGRITDIEIINRLNSPHPVPIVLEVSVGGEAPVELSIKDAQFIDDIPHTGELDEVEFHGILIKKDS